MKRWNMYSRFLLMAILFFHSLEVDAAADRLRIEDLYLESILPSKYKYYTQEPLGRVKIRNTGKEALKNIKVTLFIPEYMNLPQEHEILEIRPDCVVEVPLKATFNRRIFEIDEDTPVLAEVKAMGYGTEERRVCSITILGKNIIDWRESGNIASFVTLNDPVITEFTRLHLPSLRDEESDNKIKKAIAIYVALSPIAYLPDPNMPYKMISTKKVIVDKVQYPRETLKYRRGDCDDLSVLYASCLEAVGIKTGFVLVPGHIFPIFNTGILEREKELVSYDPQSYIIRESCIWLPVEITRLQDPFLSAIESGMSQYRKSLGRLEIITAEEGWKKFAPVALSPIEFSWEGDKTLVEQRLKDEIIALERKREEVLEGMIGALKKKIEESPYNPLPYNQLGIIYAKERRYGLAEEEFKKVLERHKLHPSILNNLGNIYLLKGSIDEAFHCFEDASRSDPDDPGIHFNLGITLFFKQDPEAALEKLGESIMGFSALQEASNILGFPIEDAGLSLTGRSGISKEEIGRLLKEAQEKIPRKDERGERVEAKRIFTSFIGTRGEELDRERDLRWILYWKE